MTVDKFSEGSLRKEQQSALPRALSFLHVLECFYSFFVRFWKALAAYVEVIVGDGIRRQKSFIVSDGRLMTDLTANLRYKTFGVAHLILRPPFVELFSFFLILTF